MFRLSHYKYSTPLFSGSLLLSTMLVCAHAATTTQQSDDKERTEHSTMTVIGQQTDKTIDLTTQVNSGSRLDLNALQTPASINSISGDEARGHNNASVQEAVARSPGIFRFGSPGNGGTVLAARGFVGHNSVMQLYDGTRTYVGMGTITFPADTWSVERIDVLRGPGAVLYGEGATGAVINVIPKKPFNGTPETALRVSGGSWSKRQFAIDSGGGLNDSLSYRLTTNYKASEGWKERGETEGSAFRGALNWQANADLNFTLSHDISVQRPLNDYGTPLIDGNYHKELRKKNYNSIDSDLLYNDRVTHLKSDWQISENLTANNDVYYITSSRRWKSAEAYRWQPASQQLQIGGFYHITHRYEQIGDRQDFTLAHSIFDLTSKTLFGAEYNHIRFKTVNNAPYKNEVNKKPSVSPWSPQPVEFTSDSEFRPNLKSKTDIFALFFENHTELTEQWSLVTGFRHDHVQVDRFDLRQSSKTNKTTNGFNWRAGLVFAPTERMSLYSQYSTSTDPVSPLISMNTAQQQFSLSTAKQAEIGIKQQFWQQQGEWTLALYHIEKNKLLTRDPHNPDKSLQIGKQSSRGIEANLDLQLPFELAISANAAYVKARYDDFAEEVNKKRLSRNGNKPVNVPDMTANLWLTKSVNRSVTIGSGIRYVGSRYGDHANNHKIPHYTVIDANVRWQIIPNIELGLELNNLFDNHYAITSHNSGNQWLIGEPRSFVLTLDYQF